MRELGFFHGICYIIVGLLTVFGFMPPVTLEIILGTVFMLFGVLFILLFNKD
jgi:hypothetical protein